LALHPTAVSNKTNIAFSSAVSKNKLSPPQHIQSISPYYKSPAVTHSLINVESIPEMLPKTHRSQLRKRSSSAHEYANDDEYE
jgi:hypothetical protein